ncbi:MAG: hypothetical protein AAGI46_10595 [Planctomycetota bacterium]
MPTLAPPADHRQRVDLTLIPDAPAAGRCRACGYLRHGLSAAARCPECGFDPAEPETSVAIVDDEAAHARLTTIGLVLLLTSTFTLLGVTLAMRFRDELGGSLVVVNFPGPKVWAAMLVQRSVGNYPGHWGVTGVVASVQTALAIWLVTSPRPARDFHHGETLRRLARWGTTALLGAGIGMTLSTQGIHWWSNDGRESFFVLLVCGVELPATLLLYLYLVRLASGDERAAMSLRLAGWIAVPLIAMAGAAMLLKEPIADKLPESMMPVGMAIYGPASVVGALLAFDGIMRLIRRHAVVGFGPWVKPVTGGGDAIAVVARQAVVRVRRNAAAFVLLAGLVGWLLMTLDELRSAMWMPRHFGVLGDLPYLGFVGPMLDASFLFNGHNVYTGTRTHYGRPTNAALWQAIVTLLVVWAITVRGNGGNETLRLVARWLCTIGIGAMLTIVAAAGPLQNDARAVLSQESKVRLVASGLLELPATLLLYGYLVTVANAHGRRDIAGCLAIAMLLAGSTLIVALITAASTDVVGRDWLDWHGSWAWIAGAATLGGLVVSAGLYATWCVGRLAATVLTSLSTRTQRVPQTR